MALSTEFPYKPELKGEPSHDRAGMRRCATYCRSLDPVKLALPAKELKNTAVAKWVRDHDVAVTVRSSSDLGVAIAAGIHPMWLTVHADGLTGNELRFCSRKLGVGRVVANTAEQVDSLVAAAVPHRRQRVLAEMSRFDDRFGSGAYVADDVIAAVLAGPRLDLVGLYCEITSAEEYFVSYPAAIAEMLAEIAHIQKQHRIVLTRIALGGGGFVFDDGPADLSDFAEIIDTTVDDACATLRCPRPLVVVAAADRA